MFLRRVLLRLTHFINTNDSMQTLNLSLPHTRFYQNIFLFSQKYENYLPVMTALRLHSSSEERLARSLFLKRVMWIFIRAHDSEFDQEIVYLKSSQSQILSRLLSWSLWSRVCENVLRNRALVRKKNVYFRWNFLEAFNA